MVRTRFLALLATADIYPIQAEGQPFDPRLHLAMATESRAGVPDGTVVAVLRKGYRQRGRVLRYAEVAVNHAAGPETDSPTDGATWRHADLRSEKIIYSGTTHQKAVRYEPIKQDHRH